VVRSRRRRLRHAILIRVVRVWGGQFHRTFVDTRGSRFLVPIVHTLLYVSADVRVWCLRSIGASVRLLIALAAQQQIRFAAGLRDIAVAGTVVTLVLVALEQVLAQATDRFRVAKDPRVLRLLLIAVSAVQKSD